MCPIEFLPECVITGHDLFDRAVLSACSRTLKALRIVDFPLLLGPTKMFMLRSDTEYSRRALKFQNFTDVIDIVVTKGGDWCQGYEKEVSL